MKLIESPARLTLNFPNVAAPSCLAQKLRGDGAAFSLDKQIELAPEEIPGIDGNRVQESSLPLGISEVLDGVDGVMLGPRVHRSSTQSSVCCSSSILAERNALSEEEAYMRKPAWALD